MNVAGLDKRLTTLERRAPRAPDPVVAEFERWCEQVLGCTFDDLDSDDFMRVEQLLHEAPDFACPLLLRACINSPEDREPAKPGGQYCSQIPGQEAMQWLTPDTPEWRAYSAWQRRRWGYLVAADDPEAQPLCRQLEAWAVDPGRAYLRGADLRLVFVTLGVEWAHTSFLELRRLGQPVRRPRRAGGRASWPRGAARGGLERARLAGAPPAAATARARSGPGAVMANRSVHLFRRASLRQTGAVITRARHSRRCHRRPSWA